MISKKDLKVIPIAKARSCYKACFGTPRQGSLAPASEAWIDLVPALHSQEFLSGLGDFSHAWLIWLFHENENSSIRGKIRPPRLDGKKVGVFASRSPHRPNPIGLSLVRILEVKENSFKVAGVDLIDGTPILDIKPYIPEVDKADDASLGWTAEVTHKKPNIIFSEAAESALEKLDLPVHRDQFKELIQQSLAQDPRPTIHRDKEKIFYFQLYEWDIGFSWRETIAIVEEIRSARKK
jgi:tRNA-Thr(GGU) m(6)t(6)A37 methyltransferase TsaA